MKVAVVTGAGRGLGRLVAERLSRRGLSVLLTDIDGDAAARAARELGGDCWAMAQDVRVAASHREVARAAAERGPVKVWVNNAGVLRADHAWSHADEDVELQVNVNVLGVMWGSRTAVDVMKTTGGGQVINMASISALLPVPGLAVYAATKHAVLGFSTSLQGDLDAANIPIKVSAVCPDAIDTDMVRNVAGVEQSALLFSSRRLLTADQVADHVVDLLDNYRLTTIIAPGRAALTRLFAPFPELELVAMRGLAWLGDRHRRRQSS